MTENNKLYDTMEHDEFTERIGSHIDLLESLAESLESFVYDLWEVAGKIGDDNDAFRNRLWEEENEGLNAS